MNVGEFLNAMAVSTGLEQDSPELKLILSDPNLTKIEVPKEFDTLVSEKFKGMVTLESAKNNPDIKKHFTYSALSGIDATIDRLAKDEFGMDDEYVSSLKKLDTTGKRLTEFARKVKELSEKKAPANDDEKLKKHNEEVKRLNQQLLESQEKFAREKTEIENRFLTSSKERALTELFQNYKYSNTVPKDVQLDVARSLFNKNVRENNLKIAFDENGDNPRLLTDQDTAVFINNKEVNMKQYVESLLAKNNLLEIAAPVKQNGNDKREPIIVNGANNGTINNSAMIAALESAAQDIAR